MYVVFVLYVVCFLPLICILVVFVLCLCCLLLFPGGGRFHRRCCHRRPGLGVVASRPAVEIAVQRLGQLLHQPLTNRSAFRVRPHEYLVENEAAGGAVVEAWGHALVRAGGPGPRLLRRDDAAQLAVAVLLVVHVLLRDRCGTAMGLRGLERALCETHARRRSAAPRRAARRQRW